MQKGSLFMDNSDCIFAVFLSISALCKNSSFDPAYLTSYLRQRFHACLELFLDFRQLRALRQLLVGQLEFFLNGGDLFFVQLKTHTKLVS